MANKNVPIYQDIDGANHNRLCSIRPPKRTAKSALEDKFNLTNDWAEHVNNNRHIIILLCTAVHQPKTTGIQLVMQYMLYAEQN